MLSILEFIFIATSHKHCVFIITLKSGLFLISKGMDGISDNFLFTPSTPLVYLPLLQYRYLNVNGIPRIVFRYISKKNVNRWKLKTSRIRVFFRSTWNILSCVPQLAGLKPLHANIKRCSSGNRGILAVSLFSLDSFADFFNTVIKSVYNSLCIICCLK